MKKFKLDNSIKVYKPGGNVFVKYNKISGDYFLSGEVDFICEGNLFV